mmetsp:Transcript_9542/g.43226  ORF Transcript_9542/g.43226 Transcript_9542/m.43226 type:complete len:243 (+) Transcript_9542:6052-6780(+)
MHTQRIHAGVSLLGLAMSYKEWGRRLLPGRHGFLAASITKHLSSLTISTPLSPAFCSMATTDAVSQNGVFIVLTSSSYDSASVHSFPLTYFSRMGGARTTVEVTNTPPGLRILSTSLSPSIGSSQQCAPALQCTASTDESLNGIAVTSALTAAKFGNGAASGSGLIVDLAETASSCSAARRVMASLTSDATRISYPRRPDASRVVMIPGPQERSRQIRPSEDSPSGRLILTSASAASASAPG